MHVVPMFQVYMLYTTCVLEIVPPLSILLLPHMSGN